MKNYKDILNVKSGASQEEIRKAYLKKAQEWHPDKHQDKGEEALKEAEAKFKDIGEAYENLKNGIETSEDSRKRSFDSDDIGEMLRNFARRSGFSFGMEPQEQDFYEEMTIPVTIQNLYNEEEIETFHTRFSEKSMTLCSKCEGTGQHISSQMQGNMYIHRTSICSVCGGQGFKSSGQGEKIKVKIKVTLKNLQRFVKLEKAGNYNPRTKKYNDLLIRPILQRSYNYDIAENGASLVMTLPVKYEHLRDGKKLRITIFGNKVTVDVPAKQSLQRMLVVHGKGMPIGDGSRGNLYIKLDLKYE